ncbi:hypothetical protein [Pseudomonas sp. MF7453]|uniref:hypothetical protein n=1 Tax=Pseudomonas sp. MF7453 TaxID=2797539 RepID=UPI0018E75BB8|nr:hypothetical protein [Pseudomonas sp. MF7453]MBJ2219584.1 hypothetical protein [Pseudomonas sp. MF7453]
MTLHYSANALIGHFSLPTWYVENRTAEDLAELAAADHWRAHPDSRPTFVTVVHLHNVEGRDLGLFEVRCERQPVFTASALQQG